jgi:hypothetical protein
MSPTSAPRRRQPAPLLLISLSCVLALAGCGSSNTTTRPSLKTAANLPASGLRFAACMRAHGVPGFPDPTTSGAGTGFRIKIGSGLNPASPSFRAAQTACGHLLPGGGPGAQAPSPAARAQMFAISRCMRAHGVNDFPDPTTSPPSNPSGYSAVLFHNGVGLAVPDSINTRSPAFTHAASVCGFGGPGPGGPGAP